MRNFKSILLLAASTVPLFASADQGLLGLVPADSKLVIGVDAQRAKTSQLGQFLLNRHSSEGGFQSLMQQTGFDPRRDLEYVMVASAGPEQNAPAVVLARGLFDVDRITTAAKAHGARIESYQGLSVINAKEDKGINGIAFPETGVAIAGPLELVHAVLSGRSVPTTLDPMLAALIGTASGNDVWFASTVALSSSINPVPMPNGSAGPAANAQVFKSVREASGGLRLGEVVELTLDAVTRSPQDATALTDVVRFMSNMMQTKAQNDPRAAVLSASLQDMKLESTGPNVHIALSMPEKTLEQLSAAGTVKKR